jgi:integrase
MGDFRRADERSATLARLAHCAPERRQSLIEEYERRSLEAYAPETLRNLRQVTASFGSWCDARSYNPTPPVDPRVVAEYVESCGGKLSSNTIETRLWAIAELHRSRFLPSPCQHPLVQLALKGVKRKYGVGRRQAPPLGKAEVLRVVRSMGKDRLSLRDRALIWAASDSWCRVSELVALKVCDLMRQDDGSSLLYIARSKTDQFGEGAYAFLSEGGTEAVLSWIECAGLRNEDPLFTKSQRGSIRKPLDPATVSRVFKRRFARADVSSHSMRVGGVHDAFRLGCSLSAIMVAGRWSSPEMPARYGRKILASQSAAAEVARAFAEQDGAGSRPLHTG